jgi:hypothetical protein
MTRSGIAPLQDLFFIVTAVVVIVLLGCAFIAAEEAWRRWSANRRIKKHLRN